MKVDVSIKNQVYEGEIIMTPDTVPVMLKKALKILCASMYRNCRMMLKWAHMPNSALPLIKGRM